MLEDFVEKKIAALKSAQGIQDLSEYVEVASAKEGYRTTILEVCFEQAHGQHYLRMRFTSFQGSGRSGRDRKTFAWPIRDPMDLSDMAEITGKVIAACQPGAEVRDPRGGFGRFFDNLTGSRFINDLPDLAQDPTDLKAQLSASIREDKYGRHIWLRYQVPKRSWISVSVPYPVWEAFDAFLRA